MDQDIIPESMQNQELAKSQGGANDKSQGKKNMKGKSHEYIDTSQNNQAASQGGKLNFEFTSKNTKANSKILIPSGDIS